MNKDVLIDKILKNYKKRFESETDYALSTNKDIIDVRNANIKASDLLMKILSADYDILEYKSVIRDYAPLFNWIYNGYDGEDWRDEIKDFESLAVLRSQRKKIEMQKT